MSDETREGTVIKYKSTTSETTERQISKVSPTVAKNGSLNISAFCHLRNEVRSFALENILEVCIDGKAVDKYLFYYDYTPDIDRFKDTCEKVLKQKEIEYHRFIENFEKSIQKILSHCNKE